MAKSRKMKAHKALGLGIGALGTGIAYSNMLNQPLTSDMGKAAVTIGSSVVGYVGFGHSGIKHKGTLEYVALAPAVYTLGVMAARVLGLIRPSTTSIGASSPLSPNVVFPAYSPPLTRFPFGSQAVVYPRAIY